MSKKILEKEENKHSIVNTFNLRNSINEKKLVHDSSKNDLKPCTKEVFLPLNENKIIEQADKPQKNSNLTTFQIEKPDKKQVSMEQVLQLIPMEKETEFKSILNEIQKCFEEMELEKEIEKNTILQIEFLLSVLIFSNKIGKNYSSEYLKLLARDSSKFKIEIYIIKLKDTILEKIRNSNLVEKDISIIKTISTFLRNYEMNNELFNKFEYLFNIFFEIKSAKSELIKKILWLILINLELKVFGNKKSIFHKLLLMTSIFLSYLKYFPIHNTEEALNDLDSFLKFKKIIFSNLHLQDNSSNNERVLGITNILNKELDALKINEKIIGVFKDDHTMQEENSNLNTTNTTNKSILADSKMHSEQIIHLLSSDYEQNLSTLDFNNCLFLSLSQNSDVSPIKTGVFSIKNNNNLNKVLLNNFNNNLGNSQGTETSNTSNLNQSSNSGLLNPSHFTAFRRLDFNNNRESKQKIECVSTNINTPRSFSNDFNNLNTFYSHQLNDSMERENSSIFNIGTASPIGLTHGNKFQMLTPITRVVSINKWVNDYVSSYKKDLFYYIFLGSQNQFNKKAITPELKEELDIIYSTLEEKIDSLIEEIKVLIETNIYYKSNESEKRHEAKLLTMKLIKGLLKKNNFLMEENLSTYSSLINEKLEENKDEVIFKINKHIIKNEEFIKSVLVCSFEIIFFVDNNQDNYFFKISELLNLDVYNLLKILNPIMTFDVVYVSNLLLFSRFLILLDTILRK